MIQPNDLHAIWAAPDNSRLTKRQYSVRLPVHVAAKLAALEEMYPNRTRTEIVADLLSAALSELERSFPSLAGARWRGGDDPQTGEPLYEDVGLGAQFRDKANRHYQQLERSMGNKNPAKLYDLTLLTKKTAA